MKKNEGSITIFSALAIVCIICFLATIVEVTRYRMLQSESLSHVQTAATLSLSQYDPVLWNEYGLMYIRQHQAVEDIVDESLMHMFYPSQYMQVGEGKYSVLMEPENMQYHVAYNEWLDTDVSHETRQQILRYMKPRMAYIVTMPFNDVMNIYESVTKTSAFIEEKERIVKEMDYVDAIKKSLMYHIDGLKIQGKKSTYTYDGYIRGLSVSSIVTDYMPKEMVDNRRNHVIYLASYIDELTQLFIQGDDQAGRLCAMAREYESMKDYYSEIEDPVERTRFHDLMEDYKDDIDESLDELETMNLEDYVPMQLETQRLITIEESLEQVILDLNTLQESSSKSLVAMESYRKRLETGDIMEGVKGSILKDLDLYEKDINSLSSALDRVDNMALIKEQAQSNLTIIKEASADLIYARDSLNGYLYHAYMDSVKQDDGSYVKKIGKRLKRIAGVNSHTPNQGENKSFGYLLSLVSRIERKLNSYNSDLLLDYRQMKESQRSDEYDQIVGQKEEAESGSFLEGIKDVLSDIFRQGMILEGSNLPSQIVRDKTSSSTSLMDDICVNLYYTKMLSNVSARYDESLVSLSGYEINRYGMDAEVEYILYGHSEEAKNIQEASQQLFALRLLCNTIHIITDTSKRTLITELATAVAGWWNGGIGTGIASVIIGAAWASMESMVDVGMLMYGEKVPFIKTSSTWYTSLDGNWKDALVVAIGAARTEAQRVDGIVRSYVKDELGISAEDIQSIEDVYKETRNEIEFKTENARNIWEVSVENILRGNSEDIPPAIEQVDTTGQLCKKLKMFRNEYKQLESANKLEGLEEKVALKEKWMSGSQKELDNILNGWAKDKNIEFESSLKTLADGLEKGKETEQIHDWKQKMIGTKSDKGNDRQDKKTDLAWTSISYSDYLLLFLMMSGEDESTKTLRFLDIIQHNLQQAHHNSSLALSNYGRGVEVRASIGIRPLWMPVGFEELEVEYESNY